MDDLRKKADQILKNIEKDDSELSQLEIKKLIEELRIHQIELQVQNEELRSSRNEVEIAKTKYFRLFQNAPVGYMVIDEKAMIREINLKACEIFDRRRDRFENTALVSLLDKDSMSKFYEYFDIVKEKSIPQTFELNLNIRSAQTLVEITISSYIETHFWQL